MKSRSRLCSILGALVFACTSVSALGQKAYESYFLYHGAFPYYEETPYSGEFANNAQGITHDDDNWFISMTEEMWKIPVQFNLRHVNTSSQYPGVIHVVLGDIGPLASLGYFHIGDISYYKPPGSSVGYVIAPIEAHQPQSNAIVLLRADTLEYVSRGELPGLFPACNDPNATSLGWVAVDEKGHLYTAGDCETYLYEYSLNWGAIPGLAADQTLTLKLESKITLLDEGGAPLGFGHTQGGVFAPSGELLYVLSGIFDQHDPNEGITVFDTSTWRRVKQSTAADEPSDPFWYHFDIGYPQYEEPEGLTIWDLDDGRAPGISGQLHVVMLDNDGSDDPAHYYSDDDDFTLYHYINTIYVDRDNSGQETGEPHLPFNTVGEANSLSWDGARISVKAGDYPEALTISRRVQLLSNGGTARIGSDSALELHESARINLHKGGSIRIH